MLRLYTEDRRLSGLNLLPRLESLIAGAAIGLAILALLS